MKMTSQKLGLGFMIVGALALSACGSSSKKDSETTDSASTPAAAPQVVAGPTDAEIAHIVLTINQGEVDAGKLASTKAKNSKVKAFAKQMVKEHSAVSKEATALATKASLTPQDNDTSKSLMGTANGDMEKMKALKGKDFDKAYIDSQVANHQTALDTIDNNLLPNAKNEELKAMLTKVRPSVAAHLDHAKKLQTTLSK